MSGPLVPVIGGPLDGREEFTVTYKRAQELLFEAWRDEGGLHVHVYRSLGGRAPFRYQGVRLHHEFEVVRSIVHPLDGEPGPGVPF